MLLPQILKSIGYTTLAVDWLGRWHKIGYDYYSGILKKSLFRGQSRGELQKQVLRLKLFRLAEALNFSKRKSRKKTDLYGDANLVTNKAIELIKENLKKEFFLFVHYWDTHSPYTSPKTNTAKFYDKNNDQQLKIIVGKISNKAIKKYILSLGNTVNEVIAKYNGSIAFVDHEIGRLVSKLEQYGILDETIIILTADHGESLNEHGIYFDHHSLYDVTIHVPLIFKGPGLPKNKKIKGFVQHTDIVPTILDILGEKTDRKFDGKSLLPQMYNETDQLHQSIYAEERQTQWKRVIRTSEYKYIYAPSAKDAVCSYCGVVHGGLEELYDLNSDPEENENIIEERREVADMLKKELNEKIKRTKLKWEKERLRSKIKMLKDI